MFVTSICLIHGCMKGFEIKDVTNLKVKYILLNKSKLKLSDAICIQLLKECYVIYGL